MGKKKIERWIKIKKKFQTSKFYKKLISLLTKKKMELKHFMRVR